MTETATVVSMMSITQKIGTGSVGTLLPGLKARVIKQDGSLARAGESGELIVTGPSMALGYLNNEKAYVIRLLVVLSIKTLSQNKGIIHRRVQFKWPFGFFISILKSCPQMGAHRRRSGL